MLPDWKDAAVVYQRVSVIVERLCNAEYRRQLANYVDGTKFTPPDVAVAIIDAMNRGDEVILRALIEESK